LNGSQRKFAKLAGIRWSNWLAKRFIAMLRKVFDLENRAIASGRHSVCSASAPLSEAEESFWVDFINYKEVHESKEHGDMSERPVHKFVPFAVATFGWLALVSMVAPVHAGSMTYVTPSGSSIGAGPVNAEAVFMTSANTLTITLTDLLANPTDVGQLLSNLSFTLGNGGSVTGSSVSSSSGQEITVNSGGSFSLGSTVATGWAYSTSGSTMGTLDVLGTPTAPAHLIIGPPGAGNTYSAANGSIAGNGPHNPFLNESATFTITGSGITSDTTVTSATFSFGTTGGVTVNGVQSVPEPSALVMSLVGLGIAGWIGVYRSRRHGQK
jgi:hypothetical protein